MSERSNQDWLEALSGRRGTMEQELAYKELVEELCKLVYNYLMRRRAKGNPYILTSLAAKELLPLAQGFAQDMLVKLVSDDFALLEQFRGEGDFISWATTIVINEARQELRKSYWNRRVAPKQNGERKEEDKHNLSVFESPALFASEEIRLPMAMRAAMRNEVTEALQACLLRLKESHREALWGVVVEGNSGNELARALNRPSRNAVFMLVARAKDKLRQCLEKKGWNRDVLEIFE